MRITPPPAGRAEVSRLIRLARRHQVLAEAGITGEVRDALMVLAAAESSREQRQAEAAVWKAFVAESTDPGAIN